MLPSRPRFVLSCFLISLFFPACLQAATLSGTLKDSTGAVIVGGKVEIHGSNLLQPITASSDGAGHFSIADLKPGTYSLRVTSTGFEPLERAVDLKEENVNLELELSLPVAKEQVTVPGSYAQFANSDALYRKLRTGGLGVSFNVEGFTFKIDSATFELKRGTISFLEPVNGIVTGAVFVGEGHFTLKPITRLAQAEIHRRLKTDQVDEDFTEVVFRYIGAPGQVLQPIMKTPATTPEDAAKLFQHWRESVRQC